MRDAAGGYHVARTGGAYLKWNLMIYAGDSSGTEPRGLPVSASYPGPRVGNREARQIGSTGLSNCARDPVGDQVTLAAQGADARPVSGGCCSRAATGVA